MSSAIEETMIPVSEYGDIDSPRIRSFIERLTALEQEVANLKSKPSFNASILHDSEFQKAVVDAVTDAKRKGQRI